jgi:DDE domain
MGALVWRWVQAYGPELERRCRPDLKPTAKSYRVDETYMRIKGEDKYLYRAVDKHGQTIDFPLTARRDAKAVQRCFRRALQPTRESAPARHQRGPESRLPVSGRGTQSRGHYAPSLSATPVQVFKQRSRARSEGREKARLAGQGLRLVLDGLEAVQGTDNAVFADAVSGSLIPRCGGC